MTTSPALLSAINEYVDDAAAHGDLLVPVKKLAEELSERFPEKSVDRIADKIRDRIRAKDLRSIE